MGVGYGVGYGVLGAGGLRLLTLSRSALQTNATPDGHLDATDATYMNVNIGDDYTWIVDVNFSAAADQVIMSKRDTSPSTQGWSLSYTSGGQFRLRVEDDLANVIDISFGSASDYDTNRWYTLALVKTGNANLTESHWKLYVDGAEETTRTVNTGGTLTGDMRSTNVFQLSGLAGTTDCIDEGMLDWFIGYAAALSASDVSDLYGPGGDHPSPFDAIATQPEEFVPFEFGPFEWNFAADWHAINIVASGDALSAGSDVSNSSPSYSRGGVFEGTYSGTGTGDFPADSPGGVSTRSMEGVGSQERLVEDSDYSAFKFDTDNAITWSFWFKSSNASSAAFMSKWDIGAGQGYLITISGSSNQVALTLSDGSGGSAVAVTTGASKHDGSWHHCVVTFEAADPDNIAASDIDIWIDNSEVSADATDTFGSMGSFDITNPFQISGRDGSNLTLVNNQHISEVQMFNRKLSSGEITTLWNSGAPDLPTNWLEVDGDAPVGYWRPGEVCHHFLLSNLDDTDYVERFA